MTSKQNFYSKVSQIDSILKSRDITIDIEERVISLIIDDEDLRSYFFKEVTGLDWFELLDDNGYFNPNQIKLDTDGNALFWPVLDYLERVSEQTGDYPEYGRELVKIVDDIVQFSLNKKQINNYYIWWYCVKILNNLPTAVIKDNLKIDKFQIWLEVWTGHSMGVSLVISDIGEKLLPKFLTNDFAPQYIYAETIINAITAIRIGDKPDAFTKRKDVLLAWDPYWVRDTFKKHGKSIGQKCSLNIILGIAERLKRVLEYKQKDYYVDIELENSAYRIKVTRVLSEGLNPGEIKFKDGEYRCFIKQFSEEQIKGTGQENNHREFYNIEPRIELKSFTFTALTKDSFIAEIKKNLSESVSLEIANEFEGKLLGIYESLYSDYSRIWCRDLKRGPEYGDSAKEILTVILWDVLSAKCEVNREEGKQILKDFLSNKYQFPIFRRFVLLCINEFWNDYFGFLDELIEVVPDVLEESDFEVEMQDVLSRHNSEFNRALKEKLKELINNVPEYYKKEGDKFSAYWQYKWLSPLMDNPEFKELYEEVKKEAEPKDGKPYEIERSSSKGGFISHKSPISKESIIKKPIAELMKYLSEFEGADFWHRTFEGEPDKEGLADTLREAVKDEPKKFTDKMDILIKIETFYLNQVLRGLKEAWNDGKEIDWKKTLSAGIKYFSRDKTVILREALQPQSKDKDKGRNKYIRIIEDFVDLIADGCRDDNRAFDPEYFESADRIFELVLPLLKGEKHPDVQNDAVTYALNTILGRTIMAYVSFSLRVARVTRKKQENWGRDRYERFFPIGIEADIWFGRYLPQMKYLDEKYAEGKIKDFAHKDANDFEWQMFMEGYLTGPRFYEDLYGLMYPNYLKALQSAVFKGRVTRRLVEHICIGYLQVGELIQEKNSNGKDSLFWKMLTEAGELGRHDRWMETVNFFWSITGRTKRKKGQNKEKDEDTLSDEHKKKILKFWKWTFDNPEIVKSNLGEDYNSFLGKIAKLTILLDRIGKEEEKWLLQSAPYIDYHHNSMLFIEYLTMFEDKESIKRIGNIYRKVLENTTPMYKQEDIELIVRRIYKKGSKEDADFICNTYGRRGIHFLKDLWAKYNPE